MKTDKAGKRFKCRHFDFRGGHCVKRSMEVDSYTYKCGCIGDICCLFKEKGKG